MSKIKIAMEVAALEDQEANKNGRPALAKLRMLQDVMDVLQKFVECFLLISFLATNDSYAGSRSCNLSLTPISWTLYGCGWSL